MMMIQTLNSSHLKIILNRTETEKLFGDASGINFSNIKAKNVLNTLFDRAAKKMNFKPASGKLFVELFIRKSGGCCICFIDPALKNDKRGGIIFQFKTTDDMLCAVSQLKYFDDYITVKQIYRLYSKYFIYIVCTDKRDELEHRLGEFAAAAYTDEIAVASAKEYGRLVWDGGAKAP